MRSRADVVRDLIRLAKPLPQVRTELVNYPWDADEPLATLQAADVIRILDLYLNGALSSEDVEEWSNAVELRDDISFDDEIAKEVIFHLANPVLQGALTSDLAQQLKEKLKTTRRP